MVLLPGRFVLEEQELLMAAKWYSVDPVSKEVPLNPALEYQQKTEHG